MPASASNRTRTQRLEVRTTPEDRSLIDRAAAIAETDLTEFVVSNLRTAARRVLADRDRFTLDADAQASWEAINRRPARNLKGLRALLDRPSPFSG